MRTTISLRWGGRLALGGLMLSSLMSGGCAAMIAAAAVGAGAEIVKQTQGIMTTTAEAGGRNAVRGAVAAGRVAANGAVDTDTNAAADARGDARNPAPGEAGALLAKSVDGETTPMVVADASGTKTEATTAKPGAIAKLAPDKTAEAGDNAEGNDTTPNPFESAARATHVNETGGQ
ncbi:MAG: hypothetical protein K8S99_15535 [Planctomycetes bacterium]|nr:hypothetical protein [Planctomycetota bacterium]